MKKIDLKKSPRGFAYGSTVTELLQALAAHERLISPPNIEAKHFRVARQGRIKSFLLYLGVLAPIKSYPYRKDRKGIQN